MNVDHKARLTALGRERIVRAILARQLSVQSAALQVGLSERSVRKWLARFRTEGVLGLRDRSSRPQRSPRQTPAAQVAVVLALRRLRLPGFQIARQSGLSRATLSRLLCRYGLSRLSALEPAPPVVRYQRQHPVSCSTSISKAGPNRAPQSSCDPGSARSGPWGRLGICPCLHR